MALSFSVAFFAAYAHRIAAESGQMRSALAATQLVLAREERLAALGGLAAAAAHELGTPLATIQVTAREMERELSDHDGLAEDASLLVSQAKRCRDILSRLSRHGDSGDEVHDRLDAEALMKEAADPVLEEPAGPHIEIATTALDDTPLPVLRRRPEIVFALRNFIENAASFAAGEVEVAAVWDKDRLQIAVHDDGPGFSAEILARLGEPYVSSRPHATGIARRKAGLGLGFFIAKTLLEATGADVSFDNHPWKDDHSRKGARVVVNWALESVSAAAVS